MTPWQLSPRVRGRAFWHGTSFARSRCSRAIAVKPVPRHPRLEKSQSGWRDVPSSLTESILVEKACEHEALVGRVREHAHEEDIALIEDGKKLAGALGLLRALSAAAAL